MDISEVLKTFEDKFEGTQVLRNEKMKNHTSFKIGGPVKALVLPKSPEELLYLKDICKENDIRCEIIGNGTNILFSDKPEDMIVICTFGCMDKIELSGDDEIFAESGALLSKIAVFAMENGLEGFEFAHGIPGTLGGAVFMNAGAYGGEMKDVIKTVNAASGTYTNEDCDFSYRRSRFSAGGDIILDAVIKLKRGDPEVIKGKMMELSEKRRSSQPLNMPSAGSTFKRPKEGYAAAMIQEAGLKGYTVGGAQVSEKHAGFVVNTGDATFEDVLNLMKGVQEKVEEKFGVKLEPEVRIIK